jgi:hypothetical protein
MALVESMMEGSPHAVVDSATTQTALGNLKGPALSEDEVLGRDPYVLIDVLTVAFWCPRVSYLLHELVMS